MNSESSRIAGCFSKPYRSRKNAAAPALPIPAKSLAPDGTRTLETHRLVNRFVTLFLQSCPIFVIPSCTIRTGFRTGELAAGDVSNGHRLTIMVDSASQTGVSFESSR